MRVIAGNLKGRRLKSVPGNMTRPTSDKIKEAAFQIMGPFFNGGICLDLFAGSGSLGIEAISRGLDFAVFIDRQRKAIHTIEKNIEMLSIGTQTEVAKMDAFKALRVTANNHSHFDLILVDPPYKQVNFEKLLHEIVKRNLLADNGLIYCEHEQSEILPSDPNKLRILKQVNYGGTTGITIYQN